MTTPEPSAAPAGAAAAGERPIRWPVLRLLPGILFFVVCLVFVQHVNAHHWREWRERGFFCGLAAAFAIALAISIWRTRNAFLGMLASTPFAAALLALIAAATMLGTFVPQNSPQQFLEEHYGKQAALWIGWLFLNDAFHSFWYGGLMALLVLSLLLAIVRRPVWRPYYWGFLLGHGGMVVVIAGAALGARYGVRGTLALRKGEEQTAFVPGSGEAQAKPVPLGFGLRLDGFEVDKYPDELRFVLYRVKEKAGHETEEDAAPEMVCTFKADKVKDWTALPESGFYFRVTKSSPGSADAGPARHLLEIPGSATPLEVQVGQTYTLPGTKRSFRVADFFPNFKLDIEAKRAFSDGDEPLNPALVIEELGAGKDGAPRKQFLFARVPGHGHSENELPLKYAYTGAPRLPSATVGIRKGTDETTAVESTMVAGEGREGVSWLTDELVLRFENKPGEPKAYRSRVSLLAGGKAVKEDIIIAVNAPLSYGGYEFYQSDWRATDLDFSGLKVVRDPGLGLVYAGMIMLSAGVIFVFYIRPRIGSADKRR